MNPIRKPTAHHLMIVREYIANHNGGCGLCDLPSPHVLHLPLRNGAYTIVDADSPKEVLAYKWTLTRRRGMYAVRAGRTARCAKTTIALHRVIMGVVDSNIEVDHINGDGLDNRRTNLRLCTDRQQKFNNRSRVGSSFYTGVSLDWNKLRWIAKIRADNKIRFLGLYADEVEAAIAYDLAARVLFGEFAKLNFPAVQLT